MNGQSLAIAPEQPLRKVLARVEDRMRGVGHVAALRSDLSRDAEGIVDSGARIRRQMATNKGDTTSCARSFVTTRNADSARHPNNDAGVAHLRRFTRRVASGNGLVAHR